MENEAQSNSASRDGPKPAIQNQEAQELPSEVTNQSFLEEHHATLDGVASAPRSSKLLPGSSFVKGGAPLFRNKVLLRTVFRNQKGNLALLILRVLCTVVVLIGTLPQNGTPLTKARRSL